MNFANTEKCYYTRGVELISQERDGKKSYYVYDGHGSVRALADESGKVTDKYAYDAFGNRLTATDAKNNVTTYTYDANNNLLTIKDALNHVTTYTYNCLNQCVSGSYTYRS